MIKSFIFSITVQNKIQIKSQNLYFYIILLCFVFNKSRLFESRLFYYSPPPPPREVRISHSCANSMDSIATSELFPFNSGPTYLQGNALTNCHSATGVS